jgi:predicted  nucleic acid-binding Zn-ribbon protein
MADTTDIEKKSLEAHVELCAERYRFLEHKLAEVEEKITSLELLIKEVHGAVIDLSHKRNDQIIQWGGALIAILVASIGYLVGTYVIK